MDVTERDKERALAAYLVAAARLGERRAAVQFFRSVEVLAAVKWGLSAAVLLLTGFQLKLSLMPQIHADRVIRQIRRLELVQLQK